MGTIDFLKKILTGFYSHKNTIDFFLRNKINFQWDVNPTKAEHPLTHSHQKELKDFFDLFNWQEILPLQKHLAVADVGTRTFASGRAIEKLFTEQGYSSTIHGIEIDAQRRFSNFHSRADYGRYHAQTLKDGHFHGCSFLDFKKPLDLVFILHPFVTPHPLIKWGLPLKELRPLELLTHARKLMNPGVLVLSSPNNEEFSLALDLALSAGFKISQQKTWNPIDGSTQKQPRIGALLKS